MPIYYKRSRLKKRSPIRPFIFLVMVFFALLLLFTKRYANTIPETILSPLQMTVTNASTLGLSTTSYSELNRIVESNLQGTTGVYGISIKRLTDGKAYELDAHRKFNTASLYKLWVMGEVYELVNEGKISLNEQVSAKISDLNDRFDIASDEAELTEGEIESTVGRALERMIIVSDNYSALLLSSKITYTRLKQFLVKYGLKESTIGAGLPQSTPHDIMLFYEKLYRGEIVNKFYSDEMLSLLKRQQLNDRIPKYLPENIPVAHKTGELDRVKHDAGIVFAPNGDYIFVVMSDSNSPKAAAENTAILSKSIYNYFDAF